MTTVGGHAWPVPEWAVVNCPLLCYGATADAVHSVAGGCARGAHAPADGDLFGVLYGAGSSPFRREGGCPPRATPTAGLQVHVTCALSAALSVPVTWTVSLSYTGPTGRALPPARGRLRRRRGSG